MNCTEYEKNVESCPRTSVECGRRGHCCQCIKAHASHDSLPVWAQYLAGL